MLFDSTIADIVDEANDRLGNPGVRSSLPFSCLEYGDGSDKLIKGATKASFMADYLLYIQLIVLAF